jgi:hypothetical protein
MDSRRKIHFGAQRGEIWSEKIITNDYANGYKNIIDFSHHYHNMWVQFICPYLMD